MSNAGTNPNPAGGFNISPSSQYTGIAASDLARQHNGNVINYNSSFYTSSQRQHDARCRGDRKRQGKALHKAAAEGQTARLIWLIQKGADRVYADEDGTTALHHACVSG